MKNIKLSALIFLSFFLGCTGSRESNQQKLQKGIYDEVMAIHDEIMPKMSKIMTLEKDLESLIQDSLVQKNPEQIKEIESQIARLKDADEAMMHWMRNFQVNHEGWPHDSIMSYLSKEKDEVSKVRDQMLDAISGAEELVN